MGIELLQKSIKIPSSRSQAVKMTAAPIFGLIELGNAESVEALLQESFPWEGLIFPIYKLASQAVSLSLEQATSTLRHLPATVPWIAGPVDMDTWLACEQLKPHAYYLNGVMSQISQWSQTHIPAQPCILTANMMMENDISSVVQMMLPVHGLLVEPQSASFFSQRGVVQLRKFMRWGWPLSYLCDLDCAEEILPSLCAGFSSVVLRVRHITRTGGRLTLQQVVSYVRRCFELVSCSDCSLVPAAISVMPEALDRIEMTRPTLVAAKRLQCGEALAPDVVKAEQGTQGMSAELAERLSDCTACYELKEGEPITFGHVAWSGVISPLCTVRSPNRVTVVVRSKNEASWIGRSLRAVQLQRGVGRVEIIVVDNESVDGTADIARALGCAVCSISDTEFSYGRSLNMGIEMARGEFVAILSAHCVPVNDRWLLRLLANFHTPAIVGAYGRQIPLPDSNDFDKRDLWITFGLDRKIQQADSFFHNANCMIRRTAWERIRFDETIRGVEDRAWAQHILRVGYRVVYEPRAPVYHHHGIHQGRDEQRAQRVVQVIEMMQRAQ